jgi:histidine triad (HIT) family protein
MDPDCIFCKLANGVFPTNFIYEDEDFKVILDANPATKGHSLILPKKHFKNLLDADEEILKKALPLAKKLSNKLIEVLKCDGVNVLQNNNEAAGQAVFHLHIHLIPRYKDEKEHMLSWKPNKFSDEEMKSIAENLKK